MQITKNLHAVLEARKYALNGKKKNDDGSDEDGSGNDDNDSDGSAW